MNGSRLRYDIGASQFADKHREGYQPIDFQDFDIRTPWPIEDNTVDALNLSHVLEHVEHDKAEFVLRECYRTLKPNGVIDVFVPNGKLIGMLLLLGLSESSTVKVQGYGIQVNEWQYHKNVFTKGELRRLFLKVGFREIKISGSDKLRRQLGKRSHQSLAGRVLTFFIPAELHVRAIK